MPLRFGKAARAEQFNELGNSRADAGDAPGALQAYRRAARLAPHWAAPWFNIGLLHKYEREWAPSLAANEATLQREPGHEGALWNIGIAATALGDWARARAAWRAFGIQIPPGVGPIEWAPVLTPIRLEEGEQVEVVWADRIDPARAIVRSVPATLNGHRYGDLVLHDGAINGYRRLNGREVGVFDALALLEASTYGTFTAEVEGVQESQLAALSQRAADGDLAAENWTRSLHLLCKACSEGRPDDHPAHRHDADAELPGNGPWKVAIAAHSADEAQALITTWLPAGARLLAPGLHCVLAPRPRG